MKNQIDTIERKLQKIINDDKPKFITINKQKFYVSRTAIENIKKNLKDGLKVISSGDFKTEEKEGGILPFLIPIFTTLGITAAGAAKAAGAVGAIATGASAIASAVNSNKNEHEKNAILRSKTVYGGEGFKEALISFAEKAGLTELGRKTLKATLKPLSDKLNIFVEGDGLFLYPKDIHYD